MTVFWKTSIQVRYELIAENFVEMLYLSRYVAVCLIARYPVQQEHSAVGIRTARETEGCVHLHAVAGDCDPHYPRREFLIGWSICYDSRRCLLRRCPCVHKIPSRATTMILCLTDLKQSPQSGKYRGLYRLRAPRSDAQRFVPGSRAKRKLCPEQTLDDAGQKSASRKSVADGRWTSNRRTDRQ